MHGCTSQSVPAGSAFAPGAWYPEHQGPGTWAQGPGTWAPGARYLGTRGLVPGHQGPGTWMLAAVEADELADPVEVGLLGPRRTVESSHRAAYGFEERHERPLIDPALAVCRLVLHVAHGPERFTVAGPGEMLRARGPGQLVDQVRGRCIGPMSLQMNAGVNDGPAQ
jgi:hypothetical protein